MNLYDVLAGQGTTHFERLFSQKFAGGGKPQTLTGQPPLSFKANGEPLISWSMLGNGSQSGTPTPDAPIQPTFCGVRTGNLYDINAKDTANGYVNNTQLNADGSTMYWSGGEISEYITVYEDTQYTLTNMGSYNIPAYCFYDADKQYISGSGFNGRSKITFTTPSNCKYVRLTHVKTQPKTMLNLGSTALPYQPYGWQIPLTCAGQTTPLYLGQTPTVRRIRKLVLTGQENVTDLGDYYNCGVTIDSIAWRSAVSTTGGFIASNNGRALWAQKSYFSAFTTKAAFKSYLAAQYAAGTPVTVWYVLAEPETAIVNEPLCKIGDYADELNSADAGVSIPTAKGQNTLTVDTELQPSEMTITFK